MAVGNYFGRARVNIRSPAAAGECDRCGRWYQLDVLGKQFQWAGSTLAWTGYLVCPTCMDIPFEQNKVLILPPDPKPRINPRPATNITGFAILGFTPPASPDYLGMTRFQLSIAASTAGSYPTTKAAALAAVASLTGIPTPIAVNDQSIKITAGVAQTLLVPNASRNWLMIYNPTQQLAEFALGSTAWNGAMNLAIGPGDAYFWANAQNLSPVYTGIVTAIGEYEGLALWAWDAPPGGFQFANDGGVLYVAGQPPGWQFGSAGLPAGAVYLVQDVLPDTFYVIGVVPGDTPPPSPTPVFFGEFDSNTLLALGGGDLPASVDGFGLLTNQLFNNGGLICIATGASAAIAFESDGGVVYVTGHPAGWPVGSGGLPPGAVYLVANTDGGTAAFVIGIVPGITPNPSAPPLFLGGISPTTLLGLSGGNLPLSQTGSGLLPNQLFNNGGVLCVAT